MKRWLLPTLITAPLIYGSAALLQNSADAREVTLQALRGMFGFLTTPFILESGLALTGLLTVLTLNEYRRKKEDADEWVTLSVDEAPTPAAKAPSSHTQERSP
jgi:hypothetical protein